MDRLDSLRLFARLAELGSVSRAAVAIGITQGTASKQLARMEQALGAQLLRRSTQGISLTEAGRDYYKVIRGVLDDLDCIEARIGDHQEVPSGVLRISMPGPFGRRHVAPHLGEFMARYPNLGIDVDVSARHVSLVTEGFDMAIRIGHLADSSMIARRIGQSERVCVGSSEYFERHGIPQHPEAVARMPCVVTGKERATRAWPFVIDGTPATIEPSARVRVNECEHVRTSVLQGLGMGQAARWLVAEDIAAGNLVEVLAAYAPSRLPISVLMPAGRRPPAKVWAFADFLSEKFESVPHLALGPLLHPG